MKINPRDLDKWSNNDGKFERIKRKKPIWNDKTDKKRDKNFKPKHTDGNIMDGK